ncbi:ABC transporter permease [Massilia sp. W12]|uniref:ABC transporter permease n=1 Tax=Massilia sp. W12 TaxID=3126507 RepID=UPI0030D2D0FF
MTGTIIADMRHGFGLLAKLHLRMMRERPEMDLMAVLLLTIICFLGGIGLMLNHAVSEIFHRSGDAAVVLVTARGSSAGEVESFISTSSIANLRNSLSEANFKKLKFNEQLVVSSSKEESGRQQFLSVRGVATADFTSNRKVRIVEGRMFGENRYELVVGRAALRAFPSFKVGSKIELAKQNWLVVGIFEMAGDVRENEIVGNLEQVQYAHGAQSMVSSIRIAAANADEALRISNAINADNALEFTARSEASYFEQQVKPVLQATTRLQVLIMGLMIPTALLGLISILRVQNLNMLDKLNMLSFIGYQGADIRISLIVRALVLGLVASLLTCLIVSNLVAGRSIELEMGLQAMDIRFQAAPWIYLVIGSVSCVLAVCAAIMNKVKVELIR